MTKTHSTKRSLVASILVLCLCFTSLIGTTFAWFTDEVTSDGNVIKTGTLDVELYYADGKQDPASATWNDASVGALYTADQLWEPGYTDAKHINISNEGTLALKYQLAILPTGEVSALANVIEVYYIENATAIPDRADLSAYKPVGTLAELINNGIKQGNLEAGDDYTATLVLKMQESAGNEYQHLSIGDDFTIRILATQYTSEEDSFGDDYDADAWVEGMLVYNASDLQAALNAGENVVLMNDIVLDKSIVVPAPTAAGMSLRSVTPAVVIDLNGKSVTAGDDGYAIINELGNNVVITDNSGNGEIVGIVYNGNGSAMTVEDGIFTAKEGEKFVFLNSAASLTINGGTVNGGTSYPLYSYAEGHSLVINDVTVSGTFGCVNTYSKGLVEINGGSFTVTGAKGKTHHCVYVGTGAELVINDGTFAHNGAGISDSGATITVYAGAEGGATINGGTFTGSGTYIKAFAKYDSECYFVINGGTFSNDPSKYVSESYSAVKDANGNYVVLEGKTAVKDTQGLIDAIKASETRIVLAAGNYVMPDSWTGAHDTYVMNNYDDGYEGINLQGKELTLVGVDGTVIDCKGIDSRDQFVTGASLAFENVTLNFATVNYMGFMNTKSLTYTNCDINGLQFFGACDSIAFVDCNLNSNGAEHSVWTWSGNKNIAFTGCNFTYADRAVNCYGENGTTNISFTDCTFTKVEGKETTGAIETNSSALTKLNLTVENCTVNEGDLWWVSVWDSKNGANTTVNGKQYVADGLLKDIDANVYYVSNANGLSALNAKMADKTAGRDTVVNLTSDIDFTGKVWTTVDSHADTAFEIAEINGNGHTIYNLTVNGQGMFSRFAGSGDVVIKDITFDGANVNSNGTINTSILTVQSYQNVLLDNVDVKNSIISGGYKVAPLIATVYNESSTTVTATLKNCDVENVVVKATSYDFCTAGMVAYVRAGDNDKIEFENCTVTDVKLVAPNDSYKAHASVYTTGSGSLYNEADGVTVTNVTFEVLE